MPETALMGPSNLSHNVPALLAAAKTSLTELATFYLTTEVTGQSQATLAARESPRTTKLYDRTADTITLQEVERIASAI
jgi:hypothetical protein